MEETRQKNLEKLVSLCNLFVSFSWTILRVVFVYFVVVVVQIHELEAKELKLKSLSESEERTKRMQHLQTGRVKSDLQSVKKKLNRERDLKMDAFHKVEDLQAQVKC